MDNKKILIVDDEKDVLTVLEKKSIAAQRVCSFRKLRYLPVHC